MSSLKEHPLWGISNISIYTFDIYRTNYDPYVRIYRHYGYLINYRFLLFNVQVYTRRLEHVLDDMEVQCVKMQQDAEEEFGQGCIASYQKCLWELLEHPDTSFAAKVACGTPEEKYRWMLSNL